MKKQWRLTLTVLAALAATVMNVSAQDPRAGATYSFSCDGAGSTLSAMPISFNFGVTPALNIGSQSGGAGSGKVTFSDLTVKLPMDQNYPGLLGAAVSGASYIACTLTETTDQGRSAGKGGSGATTTTWVFKLVQLSNLTTIGTDASNTASGGANVPTGYVEVGFKYGGLTVSVSQ